MERSIVKSECLFCNISPDSIILENELAFTILDKFPVTLQHTLVIPKRHIASFFELSDEDLLACNELIKKTKELIEYQDKNVDGFNVGVNIGNSAGQSIFHCHIHVIPRRTGDMDEPKGGVRHVIPSKGKY